jgi:hypothetical protein
MTCTPIAIVAAAVVAAAIAPHVVSGRRRLDIALPTLTVFMVSLQLPLRVAE